MYQIFLVSYFLILIFIGFILKIKSNDFESFFFAKRNLNKLLIFFTVTASWFGAASTIATIEDSMKNGFSSIWLIGMPTLISILIFILITNKIRDIDFKTLPLFLEEYYGKFVSSLSMYLIFIYMVLLTASQFVAFGKFISVFINQNYEFSVIIGTIAVIIYSAFGGYISVVITDLIQFLLLTISFTLIFALNANRLKTISHTEFNLFDNFEKNILITLSFVLGWIISPIIWQRIASSKDKRSSKIGFLYSFIAFFILYSIVIISGILIKGNNIADYILNLNPFISYIIFIGISSAIMSTADTSINIASLTFVKDIFKVKNNKILFYSRLGIILSGLLSLIVSLRFTSIIKVLGISSEIMAEGLFIPGIYALFFKKKRPIAGTLSLIFGGGFALIVFLNNYGLNLPLPSWPHSLPYGIFISLISFIIGYIIDKKRIFKYH